MAVASQVVTILIVDDNPDDAALYARYLQRDPLHAYAVECVALGDEAVDRCRGARTPDCVLLDYYLPDMTGLEVLNALRREDGGPGCAVVLLTGQADERSAVEAIQRGAQDYLAKDRLTPEALRIVIHSAIERRRLQAELAAQRHLLAAGQHQLQLALQASRLHLWVRDVQVDRAAWSAEVAVLHGLPGPQEVSFAQFLSIVHPNDRPVLADALQATLDDDADYHVQYRVIWPDSSVHWLEAMGRLQRDAQGRPHELLGAVSEVTARRRAERTQQLLAGSSALMGSALDADEIASLAARLAVPALADYCTVLLHHDGRLQRLVLRHVDAAREARLRQLLAASPQAATEMPCVLPVLQEGRALLYLDYKLLPSATHPLDPGYRAFVAQVDARSVIAVPLRAHGDIKGAMLLATTGDRALYDADDLELAKLLSARVALALDNARLYHAEQSARQAAEEALHARDEFLSIAAHELLTPVTGLKGNIQMLQRLHARGGIDRTRLGSTLDRLDESCNRLSVLTRDLLDLARLNSGRLPLRPERLDLATLAVDVVAECDRDLAAGHQLILDDGGRPAVVWVDRARVEQVLANLLSNAVKYSPPGAPIRVSLRLDATGVTLAVADRGIGFAPADTAKLFEPFGRAANAERQAVPGMGLGLYLCRQIVEQHGGRITAVSAGEGQGATFSVWLPRLPEA